MAHAVDQTRTKAAVIRVFEPALCCNTGVCGPDLDESLVRFTADLAHLQGLGVDIARHNLASDPTAFAAEPAVAGFLKAVGSQGLPLVLVDGVTVITGHYPDRTELLALAGRPAPEGDADPGVDAGGRADLGLSAADTSAGGCCGGTPASADGCC